MKIKFIIIIAIYLVAFSNCKKDDEGSANTITSKTWKRGIVDLNPSTNPSGEVLYNAVRDCDQDDSFKFGTDGNLIINRNSVKCDDAELQSDTLTYTINRTTKELVIDGITYTLAEETSKQIKYYALVPSGGSFSGHLIFLLQ
jgi:hypothetical protein